MACSLKDFERFFLVRVPKILAFLSIVPTRVGVNPNKVLWKLGGRHCPHACGGEPIHIRAPIHHD
jgi:hypothetical protein